MNEEELTCPKCGHKSGKRSLLLRKCPNCRKAFLQNRVSIEADLQEKPELKFHIPNQVPASERQDLSNRALLFIGVAIFGLLGQNIFFPVDERTLLIASGTPKYYLIGAAISWALQYAIRIADHYDTRDNEKTYRNLERAFMVITLVLASIAVLYGLAGGSLAIERRGAA